MSKYVQGMRYHSIKGIKDGKVIYEWTTISSVSSGRLYLANGVNVDLVEGDDKALQYRRYP